MKKIICMSLLINIILSIYLPVFATFDETYDVPVWSSDLIETFSQIQNKVELQLDSEGAILIEEDTGTILYAKNEHEKLRPASVTKVMTILLIMEALDRGDIKLTDAVPCSANASSMGGSQIWLDETERLTVDEMLKAICVVSANDCSVAMSEFICGSEEAFVERMNARAKELGMNDTTFKNCHGIDEDGHLTSAYDIAIMSRELSKNHPQIHDYTTIWMDTLRGGKSQLVNTNKLVRFYSGCTGLKTGSTSLALFNLSATATRNDLKLIAVVLRGPTSQKRFDDAQKLLDYGFANYTNSVIGKRGELVEELQIDKGNITNVNTILEDDVIVLLSKGADKNITKEIIYDTEIKAPLEYRQKVGVINCYLDSELVATGNIVVDQEVSRKNMMVFIDELMKHVYKLGR